MASTDMFELTESVKLRMVRREAQPYVGRDYNTAYTIALTDADNDNNTLVFIVCSVDFDGGTSVVNAFDLDGQQVFLAYPLTYENEHTQVYSDDKHVGNVSNPEDSDTIILQTSVQPILKILLRRHTRQREPSFDGTLSNGRNNKRVCSINRSEDVVQVDMMRNLPANSKTLILVNALKLFHNHYQLQDTHVPSALISFPTDGCTACQGQIKQPLDQYDETDADVLSTVEQVKIRLAGFNLEKEAQYFDIIDLKTGKGLLALECYMDVHDDRARNALIKNQYGKTLYSIHNIRQRFGQSLAVYAEQEGLIGFYYNGAIYDWNSELVGSVNMKRRITEDSGSSVFTYFELPRNGVVYSKESSVVARFDKGPYASWLKVLIIAFALHVSCTVYNFDMVASPQIDYRYKSQFCEYCTKFIPNVAT